MQVHVSEPTRWAKVPAWWLLHPDVDADGFCLLAALATYADEHGCCTPSQATLARHLKRSRPWVNRVIAGLCRAGLLAKSERRRGNGGTSSCFYRLAKTPPLSSDATEACPADDAPCHTPDTSQNQFEQIHRARPAAAARRLIDMPTTCSSQPQEADRREQPAVECVPAGWSPSPTALAEARRIAPGTDAMVHAAMFAARCRSKNYRYARSGLDDAWLSWLAEDTLRASARAAARTAASAVGGPMLSRPVSARPRTAAEAAETRMAAWKLAAASRPSQRVWS